MTNHPLMDVVTDQGHMTDDPFFFYFGPKSYFWNRWR